jgi:hypothetical protein
LQSFANEGVAEPADFDPQGRDFSRPRFRTKFSLNTHWQASAAGDANAEHDIYDDDATCDYPQPGERVLGRINLQALQSHHMLTKKRRVIM